MPQCWIFAVSGLPEDVIGHGNGHTKKAIGNFYVQFAGSSVAYDLPGGAIAMVFTGSNTLSGSFTGDGSGNFMYPILHKAGFASQPTAVRREDGLELIDPYITAAVRCAPPENK